MKGFAAFLLTLSILVLENDAGEKAECAYAITLTARTIQPLLQDDVKRQYTCNKVVNDTLAVCKKQPCDACVYGIIDCFKEQANTKESVLTPDHCCAKCPEAEGHLGSFFDHDFLRINKN